jgi:hypothetical protein
MEWDGKRKETIVIIQQHKNDEVLSEFINQVE